MIGALLTFLTNSRLARWIGAALAGIAAILTFGKIKQRQGMADERAKQTQRDALQMKETIKEVSHETISTNPVDDVRKRLRERGERKS